MLWSGARMLPYPLVETMSTHLLDQHLTRVQKNELFAVISQSELDIGHFSTVHAWRHRSDGKFTLSMAGEMPRYWSEAVALRYDRYYFAFRARALDSSISGGFPVQASPWGDTIVERFEADSFAVLLGNVRRWLAFVKREQVPDLWAEFVRFRDQLGGDPSSNSLFTREEQQALTEKIDVLEQRIIEQPGLAPDQIGTVKRAFRDLREGLPRLGRFDWQQNLYGTLFQMALQGIITAPFWAAVALPMLINLFVPVGVLPVPPSPFQLGP